MMIQPKVYVLILNYNNAKDTIECLKSVNNLEYDNYNIVVIDNNSTDDSFSEISKYIKINNVTTNCYFIKSPINGGYAAGNNFGIKYAISKGDMDYIWILNNDTVVEKDSLQFLVDKMEREKSIGICGSKLILAGDKLQLQGYGAIYNKWVGMGNSILDIKDIKKISCVIGAAAFVRKEYIKQVGFMNEEYFLYYEEVDWANRGRSIFSFGCEPKSVVYHRHSGTIGNGFSELGDYFWIRNRILFTKKYYPYCLPTVYIGLIWTIINRFRRHQPERVLMILKLMLGIGTKKYEKMVQK